MRPMRTAPPYPLRRHALPALLVTVVMTTMACPVGALAAGADCSQPQGNVDRMVCSNERLSRAQEAMAAAFRTAFQRAPDRPALLRQQSEWQTRVRDVCVEVACVMKAFQGRVEALESR